MTLYKLSTVQCSLVVHLWEEPLDFINHSMECCVLMEEVMIAVNIPTVCTQSVNMFVMSAQLIQCTPLYAHTRTPSLSSEGLLLTS